MPEKEKRFSVYNFARYTVVGVSTFAIDLALLFILTDFVHIHYVLSAAIAFTIAISINFFFSRKYVFIGSLRSVEVGYTFFLVVGLIGLLAVTGLMYLSVDILGYHYITSRIVVAGFVGIFSYLSNAYINYYRVSQ